MVELANIREDSICCGGGGGRVWAETKKGERFSELRIDQAADVGADILATCCPYCILMLDDSLLMAARWASSAVRKVKVRSRERSAVPSGVIATACSVCAPGA